MTPRLIFTVPYAGREILVVVEDGVVAGSTYDPLSTSSPATWLAGCGRCLLDRRVPLIVRRATRCLATLRPTRRGYSVKVLTGKRYTHSVSVVRRQADWVLTARRRGCKDLAPLVLDSRGGVSAVTRGRPRAYRSPVLLRTLRLLLSARDASELEVRAILQGLPADPVPERHSHDVTLIHLTTRNEGDPRSTTPP